MIIMLHFAMGVIFGVISTLLFMYWRFMKEF